MNLGLFELNDRAPGIRKRIELLVKGFAECPAALDRIFVVIIGDGGGEELRQDGAELHGFRGQTLRRLPHYRVLQIARAEWSNDPRQDTRFELISECALGAATLPQP